MAKIKADLLPVSDWAEFRLDVKPEVMDPPVIRLRLAPISFQDVNDYLDPRAPRKISKVMQEVIADAIVEWDAELGESGPIPCTDENKRKYLAHFIGRNVLAVNGVEVLESTSPLSRMLGGQILEFASEPENFLKN